MNINGINKLKEIMVNGTCKDQNGNELFPGDKILYADGERKTIKAYLKIIYSYKVKYGTVEKIDNNGRNWIRIAETGKRINAINSVKVYNSEQIKNSELKKFDMFAGCTGKKIIYDSNWHTKSFYKIIFCHVKDFIMQKKIEKWGKFDGIFKSCKGTADFRGNPGIKCQEKNILIMFVNEVVKVSENFFMNQGEFELNEYRQA